MKSELVFMHHIVESIELIEEYLRDTSEEEFWQSSLVQDAVVRRIEIIGEAVKNISKATREKYPEIPWRKMRENCLIETWLLRLSKRSGFLWAKTLEGKR